MKTTLLTLAILIPQLACAAAPAKQTISLAAHIGGRSEKTNDAILLGWPGVYLETRFTGKRLGVRLQGSETYYDIAIDGRILSTIKPTATMTTYWVERLSDGTHNVRLTKRGETLAANGAFGGWVVEEPAKLETPPAARPYRMEFLGDSYTVGYGNGASRRDCTNEQVAQFTNTEQGFAALTAKYFNADYQINAYTGIGLVRNYAGGMPGTNFFTYLDRALPSQANSQWDATTWRPHVVVIGLGFNDFSTPLQAGEPWANKAALVTAYKAAYRTLIAKLRSRYGNTMIVATATFLSQGNDFREAVQAVVEETKATGDKRIAYFYYADVEAQGCHWHPSLVDHLDISRELSGFIDGIAGVWEDKPLQKRR